MTYIIRKDNFKVNYSDSSSTFEQITKNTSCCFYGNQPLKSHDLYQINLLLLLCQYIFIVYVVITDLISLYWEQLKLAVFMVKYLEVI